jgi:hypothetical protein
MRLLGSKKKKYFAVQNFQIILTSEQYIFCIFITELRSLAFEVAELKIFFSEIE